MKLHRLILVAASALLAIGSMGLGATQVFAQTVSQPAALAQVYQAPSTIQAAGSTTVGNQAAQDATPETGNETAIEASEAASSDGQDAAPAGTPAITADAAIKAAQAYLKTTAAGTATLDDENGKLVFSVDLSGQDVKVDAMTGAVLGTDQVGSGQMQSGSQAGGDVQSQSDSQADN